jgi:hypothetical protein
MDSDIFLIKFLQPQVRSMRVWLQQGAPDILIRHTWNCINLGVHHI